MCWTAPTAMQTRGNCCDSVTKQCRWYKLPKGKGLFARRWRVATALRRWWLPSEDICFAVNPQEDPLLEKRVVVSGARHGRAQVATSFRSLVGKMDFYLGDRFLFGTGLTALTPVAKKVHPITVVKRQS